MHKKEIIDRLINEIKKKSLDKLNQSLSKINEDLFKIDKHREQNGLFDLEKRAELLNQKKKLEEEIAARAAAQLAQLEAAEVEAQTSATLSLQSQENESETLLSSLSRKY
mgnify:CR=1 FL=1